MNLELIKKLEDTKGILSSLGLKLNSQIDEKKDQYIQIVRNDFADFFKEKGFKINTENLNITASYGNLVARLYHDAPETNFMGCYFTFNLDLKALNNTEYSVLLCRKAPGFNVSVSTKSNNTDIQKEIDDVQNSIKEIKERLDNFSQEEWKLYIKNSDSTFSQGYPSIREFLNSIIE
jgi:hypothetical protein